jgi:large subunit ribosomal protein L24
MIKKGDTVKILTGKDKGKTGKVSQILTGSNKVVIEGLNLRYKHLRSKNEKEKGQKIMFPAPINSSSVMLVCPKCNKTTRTAHKLLEKTELKRERKQRICKHCQAVI